jgi:hypothetical protein
VGSNHIGRPPDTFPSTTTKKREVFGQGIVSYINIYTLCVARTHKEKETCTHYKERKEIEREEGSSSGLLAKLFLEAIEATPQILQPRLNLSGS